MIAMTPTQIKCKQVCGYFVMLILCIRHVNSAQNDPIVTVTEGKMRGSVETAYDGSSFFSFKGIPYAQPPVGELRFKAPLPSLHWQDVYDAKEHGPVCTQFDFFNTKLKKGSEDCLFLNVYTKNLEVGSRLAVMVFIHGGGFMSGSGNSFLFGPEFIEQNDVVLVTMNYRLEVLGFLCMDTPEVSGNAGLKDQVAALRWVQKNIAQFGGDPDNVTIFGESAGGASVTYHMFSPMSKGLFHKVIAQSGVCTSEWAQESHGKEMSFKVGRILGKETNDSKELLKFLQKVPAPDLVNVTSKLVTEYEELVNVGLHFIPVVEKKFDGIEAFLSDHPFDILSSNKISKCPIITGYNSKEGLFFLLQKLKTLDFMNKHIHLNVPKEIAEKVSEQKKQKIAKKIREFYVGGGNYTEDKLLEICNKDSDITFFYNCHRFIHMYSKLYNKVYMYKFSLDTELNLGKKKYTLDVFNEKGACHSDDLYYLFSSKISENLYKDKTNQELVLRVTKLWTNFAKFGDPTPDGTLGVKWVPYTTEGKEFLNIDNTMSIGQYADRERMQFWDELYCDAGLPCMRSNLNN